MLLQDLAQVMGSCLSSMDRLGLSTVSIAITSWQELEYTEASVTKIIKTACERYSGDRTLKVGYDFYFVVFFYVFCNSTLKSVCK